MSSSFENTKPTTPDQAVEDSRTVLPRTNKDLTVTYFGSGGPTRPRQPEAAALDRYVLGEEIARGGMGIVYAAVDSALNRDVAVKVLQSRFQESVEVLQRFIEEAQIAGQLQHPGVAPVHDLGQLPDGRPFLAMKLIKGRTLAALLEDRAGPEVDVPYFLQVFEQIAQTVAYAHSKQVIHRDLKPSNIMVGAFGEVQVMDWGLAKVLAGRDQPTPEGDTPAPSTKPDSAIESCRDENSYTHAGSVMGTPAYMPPEQAKGAVHQVDRRADVFALGAILCELLSGQPPYTGTSEEVRTQAQLGQTAGACQRLESCRADPQLLAVKNCLAATPGDRPADASEVARVLAQYQAGVKERLQKAEVERAEAQIKALEQRKRRRVQALLAASLLLAATLLAGGLWWNDRQAERQRADQDRIKAEAKAEQERIKVVQEIQLKQRVELAFHQTEAALRDDKLELAEAALAQADAQLKSGGPADLQEQLAHWHQDVSLVHQLERMRERRWAARTGTAGERDTILPYLTAFLSSRLWKEGDDPAALAERVRLSPIQGQLLAGLYSWLNVEGNELTRWLIAQVLNHVDPDASRDAIRTAIAKRTGDKLRDLVKTLKGGELPTQLVAGLADIDSLDQDQRLRLLREALDRHPNDFALAIMLGQLCEQPPHPNVVEAIGLYRAALASRPTNAVAFFFLGHALLVKGDLDESMVIYRQAVHFGPLDPWIHANFAVTLKAKGDLDGALAEQREAMHLEPKNPWFLNDYGNTLQQKGDLEGAITAHREAVRLDPKSPRAQFELGNVLLVKGDLAAASPVCATVRLKPEEARYQSKLGDALMGEKRYAEALPLFTKAFAEKLSQTDDFAYKVRYDRVIACAARAGTGQGIDPPPPAERARVRQQAFDQFQIMLADLKKRIADDPAKNRMFVHRHAAQWLRDEQLSELRRLMALKALPVKEGDAWRKFWVDVRALRDQTAQEKNSALMRKSEVSGVE